MMFPLIGNPEYIHLTLLTLKKTQLLVGIIKTAKPKIDYDLLAKFVGDGTRGQLVPVVLELLEILQISPVYTSIMSF